MMENRSCIPQALTKLGRECWECSECRILVQITSIGHELVPLLGLDILSLSSSSSQGINISPVHFY